jgi:hypothetical protein
VLGHADWHITQIQNNKTHLRGMEEGQEMAMMAIKVRYTLLNARGSACFAHLIWKSVTCAHIHPLGV